MADVAPRPSLALRSYRLARRIAFGLLPLEPIALLFLVALALIARIRGGRRRIDVGLGPEPLINNIHHKRALNAYGYSAETFVYTDNFISSRYDVNLAQRRWGLFRKSVWLFVRAIFRYRALFIYFNGGPLNHTRLLRKLEPWLLKIADMRVVVMPFGSDVQVMWRSRNLHFKHALAMDYPQQNFAWKQVAADIDRWTRHSDWVLSGCEWVDYMTQWSMLQIAHFSIDTDDFKPSTNALQATSGPLRVFHAPNHKTLKGTQSLVAAAEKLRNEGLDIELVMLRGVPNTVIRETIEKVDLVADQFVIGWYAMFAIEAMALEKPVLCFLREDLLELYTKAGLLEMDECPLLNTSVLQIEERLRWACANREKLREIGKRGREYVLRRHSAVAIGRDFDQLLRAIGVVPSAPPTLAKSASSPDLSPS